MDWGSAGPANGGKSSIAVVLLSLSFATDDWIFHFIIGSGFNL